MTKVLNPNDVPVAGKSVKKAQTDKVMLRNVLYGDRQRRDMTVEVIQFDPYNDEHVEFAYAYSDMLYRAPSAFRNVGEAARAYVQLFMVHTKENEINPDSDYNHVLNDLRACRTLFNREGIILALDSFFENA